MKKQTLTLNRDKVTKNTVVFKASEEGAIITSLYVQKHAFEGDAPESLKVTVE